MKVKPIALLLPLFLAVVAFSVPQAPQMGTWKLNEAKSKIPTGAPKNHTVVYEAAGDMTKVTVDGVDGNGQPTHSEWTGKFDDKDYPVTGEADSNARAYKMINDHTLSFSSKKDGKVTLTGRVVVSGDGKTRTVTTTRTNDKGVKVTSVAVYDKQ